MHISSIFLVLGLLSLLAFPATSLQAGEETDKGAARSKGKLLIVWTSADRDVAIKMVFKFAHNAAKKGWADEIELLVWGPSSKLLSVDKELQAAVKQMKNDGVVLSACKSCAESYGVVDKLTAFGIDVRYMGKYLADRTLSDDWKVLTF